ncbi:hypothetical protein RB620_21855 [Paenibacillus sp. LHD-117]|uniref:hypothetical protein n=1 Tax=Paenibacillus sp. LHD-117 TaxID=3071412 RepID=UPI0027E177E9|nr:hypothetical protein [Paenibacillus sp. LHD-117]MDQ6422079.1 hypothetical protein [Paenibacillus sp. LHD-117]
MSMDREIDDVLDFIRGKFGIPDGDAELESELAGIRMELEKLQQKFVVIQTGNGGS